MKVEPVSAADLSALLRSPASPPTAQPSIPNLQALLEKAGVKSASAQALLSGQPNLANRALMGSASSSTPATSANTIPDRPVFANVQLSVAASGLTSSTNTHGNAAGLATPRPTSSAPVPASRGPAVHTATRELWDVRRQITALQARESSLVSELQALGQPVTPLEGAGSEHVKDEIAGTSSSS